jgi:hypothetical protein
VFILDTPLADPISTLSPWQRLVFQQTATREIAADALRRELAEAPVVERTAELVQKDIDRYTTQLTLECVYKNLRWAFDVRAKLDAAQAELAALTGGAL